MEPLFFAGNHCSITGREPVRYWGTAWESETGAISVIAEVATRAGVCSYITDSIPQGKVGALSMEEAAHLWVRQCIDAGRVPPGVIIDPSFLARMVAGRHRF